MKNWDEASGVLGAENMWNVNKAFIEQQLLKGKDFILSHDPLKATGYFAKEVELLTEKGFTFIRNGELWKAVKK